MRTQEPMSDAEQDRAIRWLKERVKMLEERCIKLELKSHDPVLSAKDARIGELEESVRVLSFQSRCNDTDMPDAELVAALHDELMDITDDVDNGISGNILSKVEAMKRGWIEDRARIETLTQESAAKDAELERVRAALKAVSEQLECPCRNTTQTSYRRDGSVIISHDIRALVRAALNPTQQEKP